MEKRDPYNSKKKYENWINRADGEGVKGISKTNSKLLLSIIKDFSIGINVSKSSKRGARSPIRLNHLQQKISFIMSKLEEKGVNDITRVKEEQIHTLFSDMKSGKISNRYGHSYKSVGDYVKEFKTFWHWYMKVSKKKGKIIADISEDLDSRGEKPKFVYLTEKEFQQIVTCASDHLKPIILLAFDSGCRVTELMNIRISDFDDNFKQVNIREETSKTFGRKIKLMLSSIQIRDYVAKMNLADNDFICQMNAPAANKELRQLGKKYLSKDKIKFKNLSLYDLRHSSSCYWLPKYKQESAMKYRFGWLRSNMIHYYSEFLGMKDTITDEDMYTDVTKNELEKALRNEKSKRMNMERRLGRLERDRLVILELAKSLNLDLDKLRKG